MFIRHWCSSCVHIQWSTLLQKQWDISYFDLMETCNLIELKTWINYLSLGFLYKIVNEDCIFPNAPPVPYTKTYFTHSQSANTLVVPQSRTNLFQNFFFPHIDNLIWELSPSSHNYKFFNYTSLIALYIT